MNDLFEWGFDPIPNAEMLKMREEYLEVKKAREKGLIMSKEEAVVTKIVKSLINNGAMDEFLVATLEAALEDNLADLERLSKKKTLQVHEFADYAHNIEFSKAAIKVLQYFSTNFYRQEEDLVLEYEEKYPLETL
jgi:hypothetical protein